MAKVPRISEPVGWGKSSKAGHKPILNQKGDIEAIQTMLQKVPADQGGTPTLVVNGTITGPNDPTVVAIRKFQQRKFGWQDGVVDPASFTENSLQAIAGGGDEPPPPPPPTPQQKTSIDFVIRFRGGAMRDAKANLDPNKLKIHEGKANRKLHPISKSANIGDAALIQEVIAEIDRELGKENVQLGIICINGNSAGARNALELAAALKGKRPIKFVGCADAALFPDLPGLNKPDPDDSSIPLLRGKAKNHPEWPPPAFDAEIKWNFYQNRDNNWSRVNRNAQAQWTGTLLDTLHEIHGKLAGFHVNEEIPIPTTEIFNAHVVAGDKGDARNGAKISELLAEL